MTHAVLAGGAETRFSRKSDLADLQIMAEATRLALAETGISKADVDGIVFCANVLPDDSSYLSEHLGLRVRYTAKADHGGASSVLSIARAVAAVEAGHAEVVVCVGGGNRADFTDLHHDAVAPPIDYAHRSFVLPYGYGGPNMQMALLQRRHMEFYGTTLEQLGKISVTFRKHAQLNDNALLRGDLTVEDYVSSKLIADPIRFFDCVMRCAGAVAVIVTSEEFASRLPKPPVYIGAYEELHSHNANDISPDKLETGFVAFADRLFARTPRAEMDFLQLYDDYPIAIVKQLEDLGFCGQGEGGKFVEDTDFSIWGDLPINTNGGILSIGQPRLGGGYLPVMEAIRQLRNEAGPRQVKDARVGLVSGIGLMSYLSNLVVTCAMILGREPFE
jgi:acetyl-CoA acetyltransferase